MVRLLAVLLAALLSPAATGRNVPELIPPLNEEAEILRLFNATVLRQGTTQ